MTQSMERPSTAQTILTSHNGSFGAADAIHPNMQFLSPGATSNESVSAFDEYAANPRFRELQVELRSLLFTGALSAAPTREHSPEPGDHFTFDRREHGYRHLLDHLKTSQNQIPLMKKVKYLNIWTTECAPWLDMFDQERHFGLQVPILAQTSPAVLYALLALSARQAERQGSMKGSHDSLELYSEAIASLTSTLNAKEPNVLVTACILCVLEMMSVSPRDWRRHVEGCAALFEAYGVNGFSGGLFQAVFWCYARMDLCGAIIADGAESTVLPIDKWIFLDTSPLTSSSQTDHAIGAAFLEKGRRVPDMHANYAVYLCAKVCDLLSRHTRYVELGEDNGCEPPIFEKEWSRLWDSLQEWYQRRPPEIVPVKTVPSSTSNHQFPRVFFAHWAAISSNQLYHTACILMLETKPPEIRLTNSQSIQSPLWHARRVVGISLTNEHRGCLNNAIQPLYVAGKLFSHRDEQAIIVNLINQIETLTGWGSRWRIKDLETAWGYPRGTFT